MDLTKIGTDVGGFLGGVANPLLGTQTETTVTTKPAPSSSSTTIIAVVVVVVIVAFVGYLTFKKS